MPGLRHRFSGRNAAQRSEAAAPEVPDQRPNPDREHEASGVAAATALAIAGVAPAILVTAIPEFRALIGTPSAANILIALLILAPAGVGLAAALSGLPRVVAALRREAGAAAEQAVLRIVADTLLFDSVLGSAAAFPDGVPAVPAAAIGVAAAWAVLLALILRPSFAPLLHRCGTALDLALLSVCLHLGGGAAAAGYPIYLLLITYAGYRFGERALVETAFGSVAGFAIVVLTTGFWRQQPGLALGLLAALLLLPACLFRLLRALAAARADTAAARVSRSKSLAAVADALRPALAALGGAADRSARALAERVGSVLDLVAIEAGEFSVRGEAFDLRRLLNETLAPFQMAAAEKGVGLRWRIDPRLPPSLHGPAPAIARIIGGLASHLVDLAPAGTVRVSLDTIDRSGGRVRIWLRFAAAPAGLSRETGSTAFGDGERAAETWESEALIIGVMARLVRLIGGTFEIETAAAPPGRFVVTLSLRIAQQTAEADLDLHGCPVAIVSSDEAFAAEVTAPLGRWRAEVRRIGEPEDAAAQLRGLDLDTHPVVIVDGRDRPLAALALVENLARTAAGQPFVLFVAENSRVECLLDLDEAGLDCLLPAPISERLLANAFRGLPLRAGPAGGARPSLRPEIGTPVGIEDAPEILDDRVTPIAAHPKFASETPVLDMRTIEELRALGGTEPFLADLIETFEADARRHLNSLGRAIAEGDATGFSRSVAALRHCAGNLGAKRLCELLSAVPLNGTELRQRGRLHLQQLVAEAERLIAVLHEVPPPVRAQRS